MPRPAGFPIRIAIADDLRPHLHWAGSPRYEESRTVWNAMIDRHPTVVARVSSMSQVQGAVRLAAELGLTVGPRCGGHNVVGHAVPDGGLMIDLRGLAGVHVDAGKRLARVGGGALLGVLDRAAQAYRLGTTAGNVSHTGVAGLTLGGGMGWLAREHGLACDNVVAYQIVTAEGDVLRVNDHDHPDLFWALKGGGGNFGVVTEFTFQLHDLAPSTVTVEVDYSLSQARQVLSLWREVNADAPRRATFTANLDGDTITVGFVWTGSPEPPARLMEAVAGFGRAGMVRRIDSTYVELQTRLDTVGGHAKRRYTKNQFIDELSDAAIDAIVEGATQPGAPGAGLQAYGGAIRDIGDDDTAFSHRDTEFDFNTGAAWLDPSEDEDRIQGARDYAAVVEPFTCGVYVNTSGEEDGNATTRAYPDDKLARLARVKAMYDPGNVFRHNANVAPSANHDAVSDPAGLVAEAP